MDCPEPCWYEPGQGTGLVAGLVRYLRVHQWVRWAARRLDLSAVLFMGLMVLYWIMAIHWLPLREYRLGNDTISYLSIAEKYRSGDFANALNGYWGPMFSWLIVLFSFVISPAWLAARWVLMIAGAVFFWVLHRLLRHFADHWMVRFAVEIIFMVILLSLAVSGPIYPDLLLSLVITGYLLVMFSPKFLTSYRYAAAAGFLGAFAYYTKGFGFPFFLTSFTALSGFFWWQARGKNPKNVIKQYLVGLIVFAALSAPWVGLVSLKYHKLQYGTTDKITWALSNPLGNPNAIGQIGMTPPPNPTAYSFWEDPSYLNFPTWTVSVFPPQNLGVMRRLITNNVIVAYKILAGASPALLILGIMGLGLALQRDNKISAHIRRLIDYSVVVSIIMVGAYSLRYMEARYILVVELLAILVMATTLDVFKKLVYAPLVAALGLMLVVSSLIKVPWTEARTKQPLEKYYYDLSQQWASRHDFKQQSIVTFGYDERTVDFAYYLKAHYYGQQPQAYTDDQTRQALTDNEIRYYFKWGNISDPAPNYLSDYHLIETDLPLSLKLYERNTQ